LTAIIDDVIAGLATRKTEPRQRERQRTKVVSTGGWETYKQLGDAIDIGEKLPAHKKRARLNVERQCS